MEPSVKLAVPILTGMVVLTVCVPDVPVRVRLTVPGGAVPLAHSVRVAESVMYKELNDAVTPAGRPETPSRAAPVNPPLGRTYTVVDAE
jgi:hypothetical protein